MTPVRRAAVEDVGSFRRWTGEVQAWPVDSHVWGHYAERTARGTAICRTENVSACHAGFAALVDGPLRAVATAELGEDAVAFKDKLNYKQPGGAGFSPHQDVRAYPGVDRVVSILVAVDACTTDSGCLWLASGVTELLPVDDRGVVLASVVEGLEWDAAELEPGDAVILDGLAPHYSEANRSDQPRRVLVASYAPARAGYTRQTYYAARAQAMSEAAPDGRWRISTLADFEGERAGDASATPATCIHG